MTIFLDKSKGAGVGGADFLEREGGLGMEGVD